MSFDTWITFVAASCAMLLIPGPTVLLVLSYALAQGKRVALACATGVALGDLIAMSASLAGLGAVVMASATLFTAIKWLGAAYLIYLGVRMIRSAPPVATRTAAPAGIATARVFGHAAMVTALNPKSIVFFLAFVPQFITPQSALLPQFAILIATFVGLAAVNALAYALLAGQLRNRMQRPAVLHWLTRLGGATLVAMGLATAAFRRAT